MTAPENYKLRLTMTVQWTIFCLLPSCFVSFLSSDAMAKQVCFNRDLSAMEAHLAFEARQTSRSSRPRLTAVQNHLPCLRTVEFDNNATCTWAVTNAHSIANRIDELHLLMQTHKPYVICVTETWLTKDMPDSLFCPSDYSVVRFDRSVALFIHNSLNCSIVPIPTEFANIEMVCVDVTCFDSLYIVVGYYRSGGCSAEAIEYVLSSVQCLKKLCSTELTLVLLGDFHLPLIEWAFYHAIDNIIYNTFF